MQKLSIACAVVCLVFHAHFASAALINTYTGPGPAYTSNITTQRSSACCGGALEAVHLVDGLGFNGGTPPNFTDANLNNIPEHHWYNTNNDGGWLADDAVNPASTQWVAFDLGSTFFLEKMRVWNYDQSGLPNRSTGTANIWYSTDVSPGLPVGAATNPAISGWTQLGSGAFSFQNPTGPDYDTVDDISFAINIKGGIYVRHILIDIVTSHGDQYTGLGEVQFFDTVPTPEPSTITMLSLGMIGMAVRTRRRRRSA